MVTSEFKIMVHLKIIMIIKSVIIYQHHVIPGEILKNVLFTRSMQIQ